MTKPSSPASDVTALERLIATLDKRLGLIKPCEGRFLWTVSPLCQDCHYDEDTHLLLKARAALAASRERPTPELETHNGSDLRMGMVDRGRIVEDVKGSVGGESRAVHGDSRADDQDVRAEAPQVSAPTWLCEDCRQQWLASRNPEVAIPPVPVEGLDLEPIERRQQEWTYDGDVMAAAIDTDHSKLVAVVKRLRASLAAVEGQE